VLWKLDAGFYVLRGYVKISTASGATTYTIQAVRSSAASETSTDGILTYVTTKYGTTNRGVTFYDAEYTSSGLLMTFGGHLGERGVLKCLITSTTTAFTTSNAKKFGWPTNAFTNVTFSNNKLSFSQTSGGSKIIENIATLDDLANAGGITFEQSVVVEPQINELLEKIYPIGSIYMSVNNVSPESFLGGRWERIQDRFLLGAGSSYSAGSTGGSTTHLHNVMTRSPYFYGVSVGEGTPMVYDYDAQAWGTTWKSDDIGTDVDSALTTSTKWVSGVVSYASLGTTSKSNELPPYLAVYMWKRTG
jgi:hypothetical protein